LNAPPSLWHNQAILIETEIVLQGRLGELPVLVAGVAGFCRQHSLPDDVEFDLNLVLEELFTNSIGHGGCAGMEDAVHVRLRLLDTAVAVEYADRGLPFSPLTAPVPNLEASLDERALGGLGVHLIRKIMRDIEYCRDGDWNRTTMRRSL